jgi:hypothetical protein
VSVNKKWKFPKKGDLVVYIDDKARGIDCVGVVTRSGREVRDKIKTDIRVMWASESHPHSWHHAFQLKVINEIK